jgi:hypothetical protein
MLRPDAGNRAGNSPRGLRNHDRACAKKSVVVAEVVAWMSCMALRGASRGRD